MNKNIYIFLFLFAAIFTGAGAQQQNPNVTRVKEIIQGVRIPVFTSTERDLIVVTGDNPYARGQHIFNSDTNCEEYWNGTEWVSLYREPWQVSGTSDPAVFNTDTIYHMGQVTVGIDTVVPSAALNIDAGLAPNKKGVLLPRVSLTNTKDQTTIPNPAIGLLVYNLGAEPTFPLKGYFYWNGSEWMIFDSSTAIAPEMSGGLICASATLSPAGYKRNVPYVGNLRVPYLGGNGGSYQPGSSVTVHGLTFTLRAGKLEYGNGELVFSVEGVPDTDTEFKLNLTQDEIPFLKNGQECEATIINQTTADIKSIAYAGPLTYTTDNGREGYHLVSTTPDGKWSVRCFVYKGIAYSYVNLQLRYNGSDSDPATKDIISNTSYFWSGIGVTQNNQVRYPKNQWAGYNGSTADPVNAVGQTSTNFPAWHDPEVYAGGMPEYRYYHWSEADPTYKTFYTMEFMMAVSKPGGIANATNCPDGTCTETKVFFHLRQITAP